MVCRGIRTYIYTSGKHALLWRKPNATPDIKEAAKLLKLKVSSLSKLFSPSVQTDAPRAAVLALSSLASGYSPYDSLTALSPHARTQNTHRRTTTRLAAPGCRQPARSAVRSATAEVTTAASCASATSAACTKETFSFRVSVLFTSSQSGDLFVSRVKTIEQTQLCTHKRLKLYAFLRAVARFEMQSNKCVSGVLDPCVVYSK